MADLAQVLVAEDPSATAAALATSTPPPAPTSVRAAFDAYRAQYARLAGVARKLDACVRGLEQPQQADDARAALLHVLLRLSQLHTAAVALHPPLPGAGDAPAPWHYVDFDDVVLLGGAAADDDPVGVPLAALGDGASRVVRALTAAAAAAASAASTFVPTTLTAGSGRCAPVPAARLPPDAAARLVQRHARGRQGRRAFARRRAEALAQGAAVLQASRAAAGGGDGGAEGASAPASSGTAADAAAAAAGDAATTIQRVARGRAARAAAAAARQRELQVLHLLPAPTSGAASVSETARLQAQVDAQLAARAEAQAANRAALRAALPAIVDAVRDEEGPAMRERLRSERMDWFARVVAAGPLPADLTAAAFYEPPPDPAAMAAAAAAAAAAAKKGGKKAGGKDGAAAASAAPAGKPAGKGGKGAAVPAAPQPLPPPQLSGATAWTQQLATLLRRYEARWVQGSSSSRRDGDIVDPTGTAASTTTTAAAVSAAPPSQRPPARRLPYDDEVARQGVRPGVLEELRAAVDGEMGDFIANYHHAREGPPPPVKPGGGAKKAAVAATGKGAAAGGGGGGGGNASKAAASAAAPKPKPLPGAKLVPVGMDAAGMTARVAELGLLAVPDAGADFACLVGGHNLTGSKYAASDTAAQRSSLPAGAGGSSAWLPGDPSLPQLRAALTHYVVLPLAVPALRGPLDAFCRAHGLLPGGRAPRSVLLYGPPGAGKTHLALAAANAAGAAVVNLSPSATAGLLPGKAGAAQLLHLAFEAARHLATGGGGSGGAKDGAIDDGSGSGVPVVILLEDVELLLPAATPAGAGKKAEPAPAPAAAPAGAADSAAVAAAAPPPDTDVSPGRFKRDLPAYIASLLADDAGGGGSVGGSAASSAPPPPSPPPPVGVRIIATSSSPWDADAKALAACFDAALYVPPPEYGARRALWRRRVEERLRDAAAASTAAAPVASTTTTSDSCAPTSTSTADGDHVAAVLSGVDIGALAAASAGCTPGAIGAAVDATLVPRRRLQQLLAPGSVARLRAVDFLGPLSRCRRVHAEEAARFAAFTERVTGLADRRAAAAGAADAGKGAKKQRGK